MYKGIVIITHWRNSVWLENLLESLKDYDKYPIYIVTTDYAKAHNDYKEWIRGLNNVIIDESDSFELGAIKKIYHDTLLDEFLLLQDTCYIKDTSLFDLVFVDGSVGFEENYLSYLGKYERKVLEQMGIPDIRNKEQSVKAEGDFNKEYVRLANPKILFPSFGWEHYDKARFEYKFGRKNLVCENKYLIKYKGTWSSDRLYENLRSNASLHSN